MRIFTIVAIAATVAIPQAALAQAWTRIAGTSTVEQARAICEPKADAAADTAMMAGHVGPLDAWWRRKPIFEATLKSCMAERGFVIR